MDQHRKDYELLSGSINWTLDDFSRAEFSWRGRNIRSSNRLFLIYSGGGTIYNHALKQMLIMRPGHAFFMPLRLDLSFDFQNIGLYCLQFHSEILPGLDLFHGQKHCEDFILSAEELEEISAIAAEPGSWHNFFRLEQFHLRQLRKLESGIALEYDNYAQLLPRYSEVLRFLREKGNAQTTIPELAKMAGESAARFSREFKRDFGKTVKEFQMRELLRRAENLLLNSNRPIKDISGSLKFGNEFYFSRFFRRYSGMPPGEFRKQHRESC